MILSALATFSLLLLSTVALASPSNSTVVFVESGRSTEGDRHYSRFEVGANNVVTWETSGEGVFCQTIAGHFAGKIDQALHEKLSTLGLKAIKDQDPPKKSKGQTFSKIYLIQDGKTTKAAINKGGMNFDNFYSVLMEVKRTLKPTQAVVMKASKIKDDVQIQFELLGPGPFNLIFDKDRPEQFSLPQSSDLAFASGPRREQVTLNQKNKMYSLSLKGKFGQMRQVHYTNSNILEHADHKFPVQEIALCAEF